MNEQERQQLEEQVRKQATTQSTRENEIRAKMEHLCLAMYADVVSSRITADRPVPSNEYAYKQSIEATYDFAERMWGVKVQRDAKPGPPAKPVEQEG